ncbi:MAG: type II toxin-antitoxin system RelE/ParE family toxin [Candidatus Pseudobacter hemicellulosilyticus]|uniref:Type II toxin-antitoxin system RelE/ParE family toxin n=1 Tax=Candidatus Pseudobacter hemicellulosilyticus TaxID=3121375 RepID=A0AAJ5WNL5_9BACT|nr:MAG: type II toxin-antitoxin system RelE/ParE family toxin [Pseudobacter sp.]
MNERFDVVFLEDAKLFLDKLASSTRTKILFNIRKAQLLNDAELFKKLTMEIWEFRTLFNRQCYRIFAFWDKRHKPHALVVCTHGIHKTSRRTPEKDLKKAIALRSQYFNNN